MTDRPALLSPRVTLGADALAAHVALTAESLRTRGFHPHQRIGLCGDNSVEFVVMLLALGRLNCSVVLIDHRQFTSAGHLPADAALDLLVLPRSSSSTRAHTDWAADAGCPVARTEEYLELPPGNVPAPAKVPHPADLDVETWPWADNPTGLVQLSSGSTATPKLVPKRPALLFANCRRTARHIGYQDDDRLVPILPVCHQYGLSLLVIGLLHGLPVLLVQPDRMKEAVRFARRHRGTVVDATPQIHHALIRAVQGGRIEPAAIAGIRLWCVGGGPLDQDLQNRAQSVLGSRLQDGYGSTELGNLAHSLPGRQGGMRPLPGVQLRITDEHDQPVPSGTWGRLWVHTPDSEDDAWQDTSDLAIVDEAGDLLVGGRFHAMIRNGLVIYPAAVEHTLARAGITNCAVVLDRGRPPGSATDRTANRQLLVVVVADTFRRRPGWWNAEVVRHLPTALRPDRVVVLDALPRTGHTGKVDRQRLTNYLEALEPGGHAPSDVVDLASRRRRAASGADDTVAGRIDAVCQFLRENREQVAELLTEYSSRDAAEIEIEATIHALRGARAEVQMFAPGRVPESWVYLPSNVLLYSYALYLLTPAQYTDTLWFRPSSRSAAAARAVHDLLAPLHGLDIRPFEGTQREFAALRGDRPGTVVFTGRHENAEAVRAGLGPGQLMVFFGQGSNPIVVGADAELDQAVWDSVTMRMLNSGQDCFGPDLLLVHRDRQEEYLSRLIDEVAHFQLERIRPSEGADYRSFTDRDAMQHLIHHVIGHRGQIVWGGRLDLREAVVEPTVLSWHITDAPECSEVFSPVFNVLTYDDEAQVRELLDRPFYRQRSMCASVYGVSEELQRWLSERVTVSVDSSLVATDQPNLPFGGIGEMANYVATAAGCTPTPVLISHAVATHGLDWHLAAPPARLFRTATPT